MGPPANGIKVYLRLRPSKKPSGFLTIDEEDPQRVDFNVPQEIASNHVNNTKTAYGFKFNGVIQQDAQQDEVFDRVAKDATLSALEGFNATIFAYGQTGSGKTFTITGGAERYVDRGIIPRSLSLVFAEIEKRSDIQVNCHISYLEIYNDTGYDLLDPSHESKGLEDLPKVSMLEDEDGNVHLKNLSMHCATSEEDALNLLFLGDTNRAISETPMNLASSRSHCIFTISLEIRQTGSEVIRRSKLHLVDLAGSERVHKTNAGGKLLREAKHINTSLHYLEMVIVALQERKSKGRIHIPYRNSMMTSVLRDSLGGNCKTSMVATVSVEKSNTEESISTCRFAQRVALVQNDALVNEEIDPSMVIKRLKAEVNALREELAILKGERNLEEGGSDRIDQLEMKRMRGIVESWVRSHKPPDDESDGEGKHEGKDEENQDLLQPGPLTFERIHACFSILRDLAARGGGTGPATDGNDHEGGSSEEIQQLRQQIQQRDNEIAILVNMVKQGKSINQDGDGADVSSQLVDGIPRYSDMAKGAHERTAERQKREIKPPPPEILADKPRAFEYFKEVYPKTNSIEENKRVLKEKYALAKQTGEGVNAARNEINRLKKEIEQIRTQAALQEMEDEGKEQKVNEEAQNEENERMKEIEQNKIAYKESFQALKELKKEIEHIQSMLGNSRVKLQKDFEAWYSVMLRQGMSSTPTPSHPTAQEDHRREEEAPERTSAVSIKSQYPARPSILPTKHVPAVVAEEKTSPEIPLTGNQEADADIMAFYKAKEQLLRRSKLK